MPDQLTRPRHCYAGIDLGWRCGFGLVSATVSYASPAHEHGSVIAAGTWRLGGKDSDHPGKRYARALATFRAFLGEHRPLAVGYEIVRRHGGHGPKGPDGRPGQHFDGVHAAHSYGALEAALLVACYQLDLHVVTHEVAHVKQHAGNPGNCKKAAMIEAADRVWPGLQLDDNGADALWVADRTRHQQDVPF